MNTDSKDQNGSASAPGEADDPCDLMLIRNENGDEFAITHEEAKTYRRPRTTPKQDRGLISAENSQYGHT